MSTYRKESNQTQQSEGKRPGENGNAFKEVCATYRLSFMERRRFKLYLEKKGRIIQALSHRDLYNLLDEWTHTSALR